MCGLYSAVSLADPTRFVDFATKCRICSERGRGGRTVSVRVYIRVRGDAAFTAALGRRGGGDLSGRQEEAGKTKKEKEAEGVSGRKSKQGGSRTTRR